MFNTRFGGSSSEKSENSVSGPSESVKPNDVFVQSTIMSDQLLGGKSTAVSPQTETLGIDEKL